MHPWQITKQKGEFHGASTISDFVDRILDDYQENMELIRMGVLHPSYEPLNVKLTVLEGNQLNNQYIVHV